MRHGFCWEFETALETAAWIFNQITVESCEAITYFVFNWNGNAANALM